MSDELDYRVRTLNAERARPSPQRVHTRLWTPPLSDDTTDTSILLRHLIDTLLQLYRTPPDEEPA